MAYNLKEVLKKESRFSSGHRMCAGCGAPPAVRQILRALKPEDNAVVSCATGCLEVSSFLYPYTSWNNISFIHTAFECASATLSGVEKTYNKLKRDGKLSKDKTTKFLAFGGDGGTLDIGFQSLSGAMERNHDITYICYDNGAYMNTGTQRSSSTPHFSDTTTTPSGTSSVGKSQPRKDLTEIMVKHNIPYVAQSALFGNQKDLYEKAQKAIYTEGPTFLAVFSPCPRGWGYPTEDLAKIEKLAIDTCFWPVYEIENGVYHVNYKPAKKLPVEEFLKTQKRFKHLFKEENKHYIDELQKEIDKKWNYLLMMEKITNNEDIQ